MKIKIPKNKMEKENNQNKKIDKTIKLDINNMNKNDIKNLKISLNNIRNICNVLKEKNTIIDGMLISTKKRKKLISQETLEKEAELLKIDKEINITPLIKIKVFIKIYHLIQAKMVHNHNLL